MFLLRFSRIIIRSIALLLRFIVQIVVKPSLTCYSRPHHCFIDVDQACDAITSGPVKFLFFSKSETTNFLCDRGNVRACQEHIWSDVKKNDASEQKSDFEQERADVFFNNEVDFQSALAIKEIL